MVYQNQRFDEERALYGMQGLRVEDCVFDGPADGESALKECSDISVAGCRFALRYPFWHLHGGRIERCEMTEGCRAALWYCENTTLSGCTLGGIKAVRECRGTALADCAIVSPEFGWQCDRLALERCTLNGEYPFLHSNDLTLNKVTLHGKYSFQYVQGAVLRRCELDTKDAFWHSKNVTVEDSTIRGEYLGWYSENLHLIRCRIIGTQPLCYAKGLVLEDCEMVDADLAFENSEVQATIKGQILSVKNPVSGSIHADSIGQILLDEHRRPGADCRITQGSERP